MPDQSSKPDYVPAGIDLPEPGEAVPDDTGPERYNDNKALLSLDRALRNRWPIDKNPDEMAQVVRDVYEMAAASNPDKRGRLRAYNVLAQLDKLNMARAKLAQHEKDRAEGQPEQRLTITPENLARMRQELEAEIRAEAEAQADG